LDAEVASFELIYKELQFESAVYLHVKNKYHQCLPNQKSRMTTTQVISGAAKC